MPGHIKADEAKSSLAASQIADDCRQLKSILIIRTGEWAIRNTLRISFNRKILQAIPNIDPESKDLLFTAQVFAGGSTAAINQSQSAIIRLSLSVGNATRDWRD